MSQGARFSPLGKKLVIVGNAQHRALRLRVVELIRAVAGFLGAIAPMPGIVKEGPIRHFPAVIVLADWSPLTCNNPSAPPMVPNPTSPLSGRRFDRFGSIATADTPPAIAACPLHLQ